MNEEKTSSRGKSSRVNTLQISSHFLRFRENHNLRMLNIAIIICGVPSDNFVESSLEQDVVVVDDKNDDDDDDDAMLEIFISCSCEFYVDCKKRFSQCD
jgi:hypothetical protein